MPSTVDIDDGEAGFTLTEVLAAMLILSVAVVAILAAMSSSLIMTNRVQQHSTADSFARTYADRLQQTGYQPCATTTQPEYQAGKNAQNKGLALTIPSGLSAKPESIDFWDGVQVPEGGSPNFTASLSQCPGASDTGLQRINLVVRATADNRVVDQIQIIKRQP